MTEAPSEADGRADSEAIRDHVDSEESSATTTAAAVSSAHHNGNTVSSASLSKSENRASTKVDTKDAIDVGAKLNRGHGKPPALPKLETSHTFPLLFIFRLTINNNPLLGVPKTMLQLQHSWSRT